MLHAQVHQAEGLYDTLSSARSISVAVIVIADGALRPKAVWSTMGQSMAFSAALLTIIEPWRLPQILAILSCNMKPG